MPFKVKCTLVSFTGDPENFPCHFNYEIGDSFTYDGERFEGRICNGLLKNMASVIWNTVFYGRGDYDRMIYLYSGLSARDPEMKKYDGVGFRPLKGVPEGTDPKYLSGIPAAPPDTLIKRQRGFTCDDTRTGARFICEPVDLANGGDMLTYYNRAMDILEKVKEQPGMTADEILQKYNDFEREEVYPPIYNLNVSLMLDEMAVVGYVEMIDGRAYPK
ncbi:MAG TPA: hypothetical protein G4O15_15760 [Dehalococcoidia bacterium]|nr:hypothetical protein [Dehalococcoidia bacterium]